MAESRTLSFRDFASSLAAAVVARRGYAEARSGVVRDYDLDGSVRLRRGHSTILVVVEDVPVEFAGRRWVARKLSVDYDSAHESLTLAFDAPFSADVVRVLGEGFVLGSPVREDSSAASFAVALNPHLVVCLAGSIPVEFGHSPAEDPRCGQYRVSFEEPRR